MIQQSLKEVEVKSLGLILLLVGLLVTVAISLYVVKPQYQSFHAKHASFEMLNSQIDDQAQLQSAIDKEHKRIKELQLKLHGEAGNMPVNEMEAYLIGRLQGLAWDAGIELTGVKPGHAKQIMEFEEISFKVDVTGEYRNLYDWLNQLGEKLGFMLVSSYEISLTGSKSSDSKLRMNVTIVFYRAVDK